MDRRRVALIFTALLFSVVDCFLGAAILLEPGAAAERSAKPNPCFELLARIAPAEGPVRHPHAPPRCDLGLKPRGTGKAGGVTLGDLRSAAAGRQTAMAAAWRAIKASKKGPGSVRGRAERRLLSYVFGETDLKAALAAVRAGGKDLRFRFARVLLAECRFDPAVAELVTLANGRGQVAASALAVLVRFSEERRALRRRGLDLVPLATDVEKYLSARSRNRKTAELIRWLRAVVRPELPPEDPAAELGAVNAPIKRDIFESPEKFVIRPVEGLKVAPGTLGRSYIQVRNDDLVLYLREREVTSGTKTSVQLRSAYCGPMNFQLYRFGSQSEWRRISARRLGKIKPLRRWTKEFKPLEANTRAKPWDADLEVGKLNEGYYLLTCSARFAPMLAAQKLAVSNTTLYLRAGDDRATVTAVDRRSGHPVPGVRLELSLRAQPDSSALSKQSGAKHPGPFAAGLAGRAAPPMPASSHRSPARHLSWARSYAAGQEAGKRYPSSERKLGGRTGPDGTRSFRLDLGRRHYTYTLTARSRGAGFAEAVASYARPRDSQALTKVLVWAAQPVYRPGATAHLKGVIRHMGRTGPALPEGGSVGVEVFSERERLQLWKGSCPLTEAGTFSADFRIPRTSALDEYMVVVDGQSASPRAPFSVEEFRLPPFHVGLDLDCGSVRGGRKVSGTVSVGYFSGAPARGAEVEITLMGPKESRQVLTADAAGKVQFSLAAPQVEGDKRAEVFVAAKDSSGRSCYTWSPLWLRAAAFELVTDVFPSRAQKGQEVRLRVTARRWSGEPLSGVEVRAEGFKEAATTDKHGRAVLKLLAREVGAQVIKVRARLGEESLAVTAGRASSGKSKSAEAGPVRVTAPEETDLGQDLELAVEVGGRVERGVLLFVENTRLVAYRSLRLKPGKHTVRIPTTPQFAPNVYVSVLTSRGGVLFHGGRLETKVVPLHKFLALEIIPDRSEYRPGDHCRVLLRALDWKGRPVSGADISLGVVNDAVYRLRQDPTPDIRDFFCRYRLPRWPVGGSSREPGGLAPLTFWKGPRYAWGYLMPDAEEAISDIPLGGAGVTGVIGVGGGGMAGVFGYRMGGGRKRAISRFGGCAASERMPPRTRKNFRNTAHWLARLVTDRRGQARASFRLPDNITSWRFTARGVTPDTQVGQVRVSRKTLLPLEADLALPRALRVGDRVELGALVRNNRGPARSAAIGWSGSAGRGRRALRLGRGAGVRVGIEYEPDSVGEKVFRVKAVDTDGRDSDAAERKLVVLQRGYPVVRGFAGLAGRGGRIPLEFDRPVPPGKLKLVLVAESGLAGPLESALEELIDYPYGCVEQTMSRFMPGVIASRAMKRARMSCARAAMLPGVLEAGLERLAGFQHEDGGWGWWKKDSTNDFMTAYVLEGLSLCRQAGHGVPKAMINRSEKYLFDRLVSGKLAGRRAGSIGECDTKLYAARALALRYSLEPGTYAAQRKRLLELLPDGRLRTGDALLRLDALRLLGRRERAAKELREVVRGMTVDISSRAGKIIAGRLLEIGAALDPKGATWVHIASRLVAARQGSGWGDTQTTAAAVRGLAGALGAARVGSGPLDVRVDGRRVATLDPGRKARKRLVLTGELKDGRAVTLHPRRPGAGGFWSARLNGWSAEPPEPAANPTATIKCRYFLKGAGDREIKASGEGDLKVKAGRTVELVLECELKQKLSYLRISVPRPCGLELVRKPKLEGGICAFEEHDDGLHFFAREWGKGRHRIRLAVRAEAPGEVFAPPPQLEPMYAKPVPVEVNAAIRWVVGR